MALDFVKEFARAEFVLAAIDGPRRVLAPLLARALFVVIDPCGGGLLNALRLAAAQCGKARPYR
jgi:hypothetical protein